jgi:hypothetical protein
MLRGFTDSMGVEWRVWEVYPRAGNQSSAETFSTAKLKGTLYAEGWLCFESGSEKRRLAPIPPGWQSQEHGDLQHLLEQATPVALRRQSGSASV